MPWTMVAPVLDPGTRKLCLRPYPGHPRGCPNFGRKKTCPPVTPLFDRAYLAEPVYAVYATFDLATHVARMRALHPLWTERQLRCCLYWQNGARKRLRQECREFLAQHPGVAIEYTPEGAGVNVFATMLAAGHALEWPPVRQVYTVALAAWPRPSAL